MTTAETLPGLLLAQAERHPTGVAIRRKHLGIWQQLTWADYAQAVRELGLALDEAGISAGDRVLLFAENEPGWLIADLAVQSVGAISVAVFPALGAEELAGAVADARASVAFCGDQEHVDRLVATGAAAAFEQVVVFATRGLHAVPYHELPLVSLATLRARGAALVAERPGRYEELVGALRPEDVAFAAFTSGTTGPPKGVLLRHGGQVALARAVVDRLSLTRRERSFSLLPLADPTARLFDAHVHLVAGSSVNFPESGETVRGDLAELGPTVLLGSPRLLEQIKGEAQLRIERAGLFKRLAYRAGMNTLSAGLERRLRGGRSSLPVSLAQILVGRWVVDRAGLSKLRYAGVGGSVVAPELLRWFWALAVPVYAQYGQVETGGLVSMQTGLADAGSAGLPVSSDVEVRAAPDGELLVRSRATFAGYLRHKADSEIDDGWFHTGDLGRVDPDGRVVPRGRCEEALEGGELLPAEVEGELKLSPYVAHAVVIAGGGRIGALLELQYDTVADWARRRGLPVTNYESLVANPDVQSLIDAEIDAASERLPAAGRVSAWRLLPRPLQRELTPTGKVKRAAVLSSFEARVDEMLGSAEPVAPAPE